MAKLANQSIFNDVVSKVYNIQFRKLWSSLTENCLYQLSWAQNPSTKYVQSDHIIILKRYTIKYLSIFNDIFLFFRWKLYYKWGSKCVHIFTILKHSTCLINRVPSSQYFIVDRVFLELQTFCIFWHEWYTFGYQFYLLTNQASTSHIFKWCVKTQFIVYGCFFVR